jgi:hypothetical protein
MVAMAMNKAAKNPAFGGVTLIEPMILTDNGD